MVFPADTFQEATELAIEASNQLHGVINGDANAEVIVEDGSKIPSVRKAMVDSLYFKPPIAWAQGEYEDTYNQLREFVDGDVRTWWFAKGATVSTPVLMTTNPAIDVNWTLWSAVTLNAATYETQKRLAAEAGLNMVGSFLLGGTVTNVGDVVFYETDGKYYGWGGTLPKTVPAGSTPATSGGIGVGAWVDKTDLMLRSELSEDGGVDLVNGALKDKDVGLKPIYKLASYDNANIYQSWLDSVAAYGYVYLSGNSSTQYTLTGTHSDLYGTTVISDPDVTLVVSDDQYPLLGSLKIKGDLIVKTASINTTVKTSKIDKVSPVARLKNNLLKSSIINFSDCYIASILGDAFTPVPSVGSSGSAILFPLTIGSVTGIFSPITAGEAISAHARLETGAADNIGVMLRCSNGWVKINGQVGSTTYSVSHKAIGASVVSGATITPSDSSLLSYAAGNSSLGISLKSSKEFLFLINGTAKVPIGLDASLGDILDVGFIFDGVAHSATGRITGLCCYRAEKSAYGFGPLNINIYGDSTADEYAGSFDKYLPQLLDGENASRSVVINNYAIAGQTFQQQFDLLQANGPGDAYIICMVAGTNDIQGLMTADAFVSKVTSFIDYCESHGRIPMLVEPWLWYPKTMIGGSGQASSNYQYGAELREAGKRVAISRGAIYVSTTHELPAPVPDYFGSNIDPLLRDDIHQSQLGYRLYAELIASHIIEYMGRITKVGISVPSLWKTSIVNSINSSNVTEKGISGSLVVDGFSNGATLLTLPRWCRPVRTIQAPAVFTTAGGALASCYVTVTTAGDVSVNGLTQTTSTIVFSVNW